MTPRHCCRQLAEQVDVRCEQHPEPGSCGDYLIGYTPMFDEYGLWIHDVPGESTESMLPITFCPFCGAALPSDRRDEWFARLEQMGVEPEDAPAELKQYGWWLPASG